MSHSKRRIKRTQEKSGDSVSKVEQKNVIDQLDNLRTNVKQKHEKMVSSTPSSSNRGYAALGIIIIASVILIGGYQLIGPSTTPPYIPPTGVIQSTGGFYFDQGASLLVGNGKINLLYVGAEYCPYCATQRWAIITALEQLGNYAGLVETTSAQEPGIPPLATYSFVGSSYTSDQIDFESVETANSAGQPLQTMNNAQEALFSKYNTPGSIPFMIIGGAYYKIGAGTALSLSLFFGLTQSEIQAQIDSGSGSLFAAINTEANNILAIISKIQSDISPPSST